MTRSNHKELRKMASAHHLPIEKKIGIGVFNTMWWLKRKAKTQKEVAEREAVTKQKSIERKLKEKKL